MIQNSLDAADGSGNPVKVRFSLRDDVEFGRDELKETLGHCISSVKGREGDDAKFIEHGHRTLGANRPMPCLVVDDFNTVGLAGERLDLLLKGDAASYKDNPASLGNRGVGKYAAFAVSYLNTVLYSSQFRDGTGPPVRAFQGKSSLVSHVDASGTPRGRTGYYGINNWDPIREPITASSQIPEDVRRNEIGTSVIIVGFDKRRGWEEEIVASVLTNFYVAVLSGKLEVEVAKQFGGGYRLTSTTIAEVFETLVSAEDATDETREAYEYFKCVSDPSDRTKLARPTQAGQLPNLGHCKIWIRVDDDLPRKVEIVRQPGMVICNAVGKLTGIKNLRSYWDDFAAVVVCEGPEGNALLKRMEPPEHNDFRPELIEDEDDRSKGERALKELGGRIREWLDFVMPQPEGDEVDDVDELAEFFPDVDEKSGGDGSEIDPFGNVTTGGPRERLPTVRQSSVRRRASDDEDGDPADHEGKDVDPDPKPVRPDPDGNRSMLAPRKTLPLADVLAPNAQGKEFTVSFTPLGSDLVSIHVRVAGEERNVADYLEITELRDLNGRQLVQGQIPLVKGERVKLVISTAQPFPAGRALILEAGLDIRDGQQ